MPPRHPLFQKCIAQLDALPNLKAMVTAEPFIEGNVLADGQLAIRGPNEGVDYICEIKLGLTNDIIGQVIEYVKSLRDKIQAHQRPLLITQRLSNLVIDQLLAQNIEFIDVDGSLYLNSPAAYVLVRPQPKKEKDSAGKAIELTAASLQVICAILVTPRVLRQGIEVGQMHDDIPYLARVAGVSDRTIKTTLEKLQTLHYVQLFSDADSGNYYGVLDSLKLLERWELGYTERLRAKLWLGTFSPAKDNRFSNLEEPIKDLSENYQYWIGGELGAAIKTQYLRPMGTTLHLDTDNYRQLAVELRLKPDPKGTITLLKSFGQRQSKNLIDDEFMSEFIEQRLAHPLLIHAELMQSADSRLSETARLIYDRYLDDSGDRH